MPRLFVLFALALGLVACAKGATTAGTAKLRAADYHPLAVGNSWTYVGKMKGQPVAKTVSLTGMKDGFFVDSENGGLKVDAEGLRDEKRYLLKEPLERGKTWSSIVSVSSTEHYEIADTGFTTTVPAGTFNDCVLVRATNRADQNHSLKAEWTYAPDVGIVRIYTAELTGGQELLQLLVELKSSKIVKP